MMWNGWCQGVGSGQWIMMALLWIVIIGVGVWGLTRIFPRSTSLQDPASVLEARLAEGDIDLVEYKKIKAELRGRSSRR